MCDLKEEQLREMKRKALFFHSDGAHIFKVTSDNVLICFVIKIQKGFKNKMSLFLQLKKNSRVQICV